MDTFEKHRDAFNEAWREYGFMTAMLTAKIHGVPEDYVLNNWMKIERTQ